MRVKRFKRIFFVVFLVQALLFSALYAADEETAQFIPHVLSSKDTLRINAVSSPRLSPDGKWVLYTKRIRDMEDEDMMNEDLDLGHQDDEPGMLKGDLYRIGKYAMELYQMMDDLEGKGEVDFPHWWQSKIVKAKDMIVGAKHYLDF